MSLSADIISQKKDLVVTSCKKLGAEELTALRSSPIHTVFEVYAQDDVDVSRRKLHQIQYLMSEDRDRKPFIFLTNYSAKDVSGFASEQEPNEAAVDRVCMMDQLSWLIHGKTAVIDAGRQANPGLAFSLTPIEAILKDAMTKAGIEFDAQVSLGKYTADFIVRLGDNRFLVEADGRAYHNPYRDGKRDEDILKAHSLRTLRLTGGEIFHDAPSCIQKIKDFPSLSIKSSFKAHMESEDRLDQSQLKAIKHQFGSARVVAPAGSGKTKVLVNHVADLVNRGVSPTEVLCLAFNKDAAEQMRERLSDLGVPCSRQRRDIGKVTVATFNSFGLGVLNETGVRLDVLNEKETEQLAIRVLQNGSKALDVQIPRLRGQSPWLQLLDEMSRIKSGLVLPSEASIEFDLKKNETLELPMSPFFNEWERVSSSQKKITFDDQIYQPIRLLMSKPILRSSLLKRYRHIIVDEYQDLSPSQIALLKLIASSGQQVFGVGDDDQLIYAWRHVSDSNISDFEKSFGFAKTYKLSVNYRSSRSVVHASQRLISFNKNRIEKSIKPGDENPVGEASLEVNASVGDQLASTVKKIKSLKKDGSSNSNSIAILTRHNAEQLLVAHALDVAGIPRERLKNGLGLYTTRVASILHDYLSVIADPTQSPALQICGIINQPNRYLTNQFVEHLRDQQDCWNYIKSFTEHATGKPVSNKAYVEAFEEGVPGISDKWRSDELVRFVQLIESWNKHLSRFKPAKLIADILSQADFRKHQDKEAIDQTEVTDEMIIDLVMNEASKFKKLEDFMVHFAERAKFEKSPLEKSQASQAEDKEKNKHRVAIRTIHGAKGLEWTNVFLFDIHDKHGISTGHSSKANKQISEEDRRVFYVALTRARTNIYVHARPQPMSSFILETFIPQDLKGSKDPAGAAKNKISNMEKRLDDLRREAKSAQDMKERVRVEASQKTKELEEPRRRLQEMLNDNKTTKPSSWLATKLLNGRMTHDQIREQRQQLEKDIEDIDAQLLEHSDANTKKKLRQLNRQLSSISGQLEHQEPILAELRLCLPNFEQISSALSPQN